MSSCRKAAKDRDPEVGLEGVFRSVFPIEDFNRTASLEYLGYEISEPKYDQAECISKGLTYEAPVRIKVRLDVYDVEEGTATALSATARNRISTSARCR